MSEDLTVYGVSVPIIHVPLLTTLSPRLVIASDIRAFALLHPIIFLVWVSHDLEK
jgi:hypothetical protein